MTHPAESIGPSTPLEPATEPEELPPSSGGAKRALWAMIDQGVVSIGNFGTLFILGRLLPPAAFGLFNVLFEVIFFINSLQAALVIYPLSVWGARSGSNKLRGHILSSLGLTTMICIAFGVLAITVGVATGHTSIACWGALATLMWQLQETTRRGLMAHLRFREAILGDGISYVGQAAILLAIGIAKNAATLEVVFIVMAVTSTAGLLAQLWQLGIKKLQRVNAVSFGLDAWKLSQWAFYSALVNLLTVHGYPWLIAASHGLTNEALFAAYGTLMKLTNPLMTSMQGLIIPAAALAASRGGSRAACRVTLKYGLLGLGLLAPYYLTLLLFPNQILWIIFKKQEYLNHSLALDMWIAGYTLLFVGNLLTSLLNALEQSQSSFVSQIVCAIATLIIAVPLTIAWGMIGAVIGGMLTNVARVAVLFYMLRIPWRGQGRGFEVMPASSPSAPASSAA